MLNVQMFDRIMVLAYVNMRQIPHVRKHLLVDETCSGSSTSFEHF